MADQETTPEFANGPQALMVLDWEEVKGAAQAAFDVWVAGGKLQWAKEVWDQDAPTYSYWAEELNLDDFVLGQLVGLDRAIEKDDALNHLVNAARPQVVSLLMQLFGNVNSLFVALWRTAEDSVSEETMIATETKG